MGDWVDSIVARTETAAAAYNKRVAAHNADIDAEIAELDYIVNNELRPGSALAEAQAAIMRAQVRLLKKQWESLRIE